MRKNGKGLEKNEKCKWGKALKKDSRLFFRGHFQETLKKNFRVYQLEISTGKILGKAASPPLLKNIPDTPQQGSYNFHIVSNNHSPKCE